MPPIPLVRLFCLLLLTVPLFFCPVLLLLLKTTTNKIRGLDIGYIDIDIDIVIDIQYQIQFQCSNLGNPGDLFVINPNPGGVEEKC